MKVVFGEENRLQLWNNAYDIPPWTTHLAHRVVYTLYLQVQRQPQLSHTPHNLPDLTHDPSAFTEIILGIDWFDDLKAQGFSIQYITNLKQKRSNLLTNQPWTPHHAGVLFNQGDNKETRQACHTRQLPSTPGLSWLHFFFFFAYCKHWRRKKPGNKYNESYTTWLLHQQANLLPHLLLKPNQTKRKKKLGYTYTWSEFEPWVPGHAYIVRVDVGGSGQSVSTYFHIACVP